MGADMTFSAVMEQAGIPLIVFAVCIYFGIRLMVFKDINSIRSKNKPPVKDEEMYIKWGGILILLFGVGALGMALLLLVNITAAVIEIIAVTTAFGIAWKTLCDKCGA